MKTILLVDDNTFILESLSVTIHTLARDYAVLTARNGGDAIEIIKGFRIDLILTDIDMPVMDGYRLIEYRNRHRPLVPLLVMTAGTSRDAMQRLNALGIADHLEKPFEVETLTRLIRNKLDARQCPADPVASGFAF